jgi:hypothetical protein
MPADMADHGGDRSVEARLLPWLALWSAFAIPIGCDSDAMRRDPADAAVAMQLDASSTPSVSHANSVGVVNCADVGAAVTGIQIIPEFVTVFRHVSAECESLASAVLLHNGGASSIEIIGLRASLRFSVDSVGLPLELAPRQSLPVRLAYLGDNLDSETGTLTVATSAGCLDLSVLGLASATGLMTFSDLAIDFGEVRAGTRSEPREFTIKQQRTPTFPASEYGGFSVAPAEPFELISAPDAPLSPASCEEIRFQVRFKAAQAPGRVEGSLGWYVSTETDRGVAEGIVYVPLYGTAVAD